MATWRESLRDLLQGLPLGRITLSQVYEAAGPLAAAHPDNNSVEATIRRELQNIRDEGRLVFLGNGEYLLRPLGGPELAPIVSSGSVRSKAEPGAPDTVPLENLGETTYAVTPSQSKLAVKQEQLLVADFHIHLQTLGHVGKRWRIPTASNGTLFTDVFDVTSGVLYEAKSTSSRESIRMAIGQLFDYRRYLDDAITGVSILVSDRPNDDLLELLLDVGVGCTHRQESAFVEVVGVRDAASAERASLSPPLRRRPSLA